MSELAPIETQQSLLTLPPKQMIARAKEYAEVLADVIDKQKLYTVIQGKKYVRVEGWLTLGTMLGFTAKEREVKRLDDGSYEAMVEIVRYSDGTVLGGASALCSVQEKRWGAADEYARRSMAITRAVGKAYRINFSWIVALSGYETTPEEEMPKEEPKRNQVPPKDRKQEIYRGEAGQEERLMKKIRGRVPAEKLIDVHLTMIDLPMTEIALDEVIKSVNAQ